MNDARTMLVTGGGRGLGRAVVRRLAGPGVTLAVHFGRDATAAEEAAGEARAAGAEAFTVRAEFTSPDAPAELAAGLEKGLRERGAPVALDVLVNNAGVGCRADAAGITAEQLDRTFAVNVRAPLMIVQRLLPLLRTGGRIVNIGSAASRVAHPHIIGYAMSKGALDAFTRSLAAQLGPRGITVNSVAPGLIVTELNAAWLAEHPEDAEQAVSRSALGRLGRPEDVADVVAFLVSDQARWMTGERVELTGGAYL